jgi:hypothetical protein
VATRLNGLLIKENKMEARRLDHNTYDIFFGTQFSPYGSGWTRVRQGRNGTYRIAGERVDHQTLRELDSLLAPNMPITYGQDMHTMSRNCYAIATR